MPKGRYRRVMQGRDEGGMNGMGMERGEEKKSCCPHHPLKNISKTFWAMFSGMTKKRKSYQIE